MLSFPVFRTVPSICLSRLIRKSSPDIRGCKYIIKGRLRRPKEAINYAPKSNRPIVKVWPNMSIRDLAKTLEVDPDYVFHLLLKTEYADVFDEYEDRIEGRDLIARLVNLAGYRSEFIERHIREEVEEDKDVYKRPPADPDQCSPRSPVVTIMGHVDHGKTTLLDALRHSQITAQEFGGITQHIGAFVVKLPHTGAKITFLDTPGHAAFKSMRARGARVTDIVVLVVAADDGVMEQTLESIRFAREAGVSMVVAINKCDRPNADVKNTKAGLLAQNIHLEEYGGDVQTICISALKGTNLVALQEAILAQADLMNLRADFKGLVEGAVVEAKTVQGKGYLANNDSKKGSIIVAGETWCRVRVLYDEFGKMVGQATPSTPVEVTGWRDGLPSAGDEILEVESEQRAREVVAWRKKKAIEAKAAQERPLIERRRAEDREKYEAARRERLSLGYLKFNPNLPLPQTTSKDEQAEIPQFNVIIKGDVDGSVEAILEVYETYASTKCIFDVVSFGVGPVVEKDLELAELSKAKIYCFNVSNSGAVEKQAIERNLEIKHFNVIYKLVDDWRSELSNLLPWMDKEEVQGEGVVLKQFLINERGKKEKIPVAGCRVTKGVLSRKQRIRFLRDGKIIVDGAAVSMRKEKLPVNSANESEEVGIVTENNDVTFQANDIVQCYDTTKIPQTIDWSPPGF